MADISKRERIMEHLKARFEARQAGVDGALYTWNTVTRRPISRVEVGMGETIGLFDVREVKNQEMLHMRCDLTVVIEFYCSLMIGDEPATELNKMLLDVQRTIRADIYCSGLTLNLVESRNELDIDGPTDNLVAGVVEFTVTYRHLVDDPSA
jgi:hypothetical protein